MSDQEFYISEDLLASKVNRFVNHVIDLIPQYAITYGLAYGFFYFGEFTGDYTLNNYWNGLSTIEDYTFSYILLLLYYFLMESLTNRTLGKYVTKTMVVMADGSKPTKRAIFKRSLCRLIPFDGLSFLGTNGKGWHDSMSKTYVVDVARYNERRKVYEGLEQIGRDIEN